MAGSGIGFLTQVDISPWRVWGKDLQIRGAAISNAQKRSWTGWLRILLGLFLLLPVT